MVDHYDAICTNAFSTVDGDTSTQTDFYAGIIGSVIKLINDTVDRSIIIGITYVLSPGLSNSINNGLSLSVPGKLYLLRLLLEEFEDLLSRSCNLPVRHLKELTLSYYSGYTFENKCVLNTWTVSWVIPHKRCIFKFEKVP